MIKRYNIPSGAKWEDIVGYSRAVKIGSQLFISGTTAIDESGTIIGPDDPVVRAPTVAVTLDNQVPAAAAWQLAEHRIMAGAGHFYGVRPLDGMGIPLDTGVLRLSFVHYTTETEIDQLITALDSLLMGK